MNNDTNYLFFKKTNNPPKLLQDVEYSEGVELGRVLSEEMRKVGALEKEIGVDFLYVSKSDVHDANT